MNDCAVNEIYFFINKFFLAYSIVYRVLDSSTTVTTTLKLIAIQQNEINKDSLRYGSQSRDV